MAHRDIGQNYDKWQVYYCKERVEGQVEADQATIIRLLLMRSMQEYRLGRSLE